MKIRWITLFLLFIANIGYAQTNSKPLQSAYKNKSISQLKQFFENWHNEIPAIDETEYSKLNDTLKQAYNVFTAFYQPTNIKALGGSEWGNEIYDKVDYLIIQNSASVFIRAKIYNESEIDSIVVSEINKSDNTDSIKRILLKRGGQQNRLSSEVIEQYTPLSLEENKNILVSKIINFRPKIDCQDKKALYLVPAYDTLLNAFLGDNHLKLGAGGIMNPARSKGESAERQKFLENFIKIWYGHWGGYWQLYSYPTANSIIFDKNMKYAIVTFTMVYEGGDALLKNNNGKWELVSAKRTWIE